MRNLTLPLIGIFASGFSALPATAQQIDNTINLPEAQPGECYAKAITPPKFDLKTSEVVLQEESERIEAVEAEYKEVERMLIVKEASEKLNVREATYKTVIEEIEISAAEQQWTSSVNGQVIPASPDMLAHIVTSGVDLDSAAPGSCFTEYFIEAQYETQSQRVLVKPSEEKITVTPAEFESVEEQIEVKEASVQIVDVPAVYRTESESVLVEPARTVWEHCGLVERSDNTAGEIMCLTQVPERYETLTKTVLDQAATTKTVSVPAEYQTVQVQRLVKPSEEIRESVPAQFETITKRVKTQEPQFFWLAKDADVEDTATPTGRVVCLDAQPAQFTSIERIEISEPAVTVTQEVPAEFQSVAAQLLITPATERRIIIPARTRTVTSREQVAPGKLEWRQVLCETDMTPEIISSIQRALQREGFNPGPADGIAGRNTFDAVEKFQTENGLGRGGITFEALEELEVKTAAL